MLNDYLPHVENEYLPHVDKPLHNFKAFFNDTTYDIQMKVAHYWIESPLNYTYKEICKKAEFSLRIQKFLLEILIGNKYLSNNLKGSHHKVAFSILINLYEFFTESFVLNYYKYFKNSITNMDYFFLNPFIQDLNVLYATRVLYDIIAKGNFTEMDACSLKLFSLSAKMCVKASKCLYDQATNEDEYLHAIANLAYILFSLKKNGVFWLKVPYFMLGSYSLMTTTENILRAVSNSNQWGGPDNIRNILFSIIYEHIGPDSFVGLNIRKICNGIPILHGYSYYNRVQTKTKLNFR